MANGERPPLPPQRPVELLAPAGDPTSLKAAVENGADAVYLGGDAFNARKFAANFDDEELQEAIDHAHLRGVRVFVTLNTLIKNHEFAEAISFLEKIRRYGADAVIVQDLGIMRAVHELFPDLPLHISTQATVHNSEAIRFLEDLGAERVILARENSLDEMSQMGQETGAELEQFVHGAMCYCYSGQCLMSSLIGGRSGNRGACAYTCRLPYTMEEGDGASALEELTTAGTVETTDGQAAGPPETNVTFLTDATPAPWHERAQQGAKAPNQGELPANPTPGFLPETPTWKNVPGADEKHIISARDMNTLESVDRLIEAGVTSFKIEGRMKRPEYVATVVRAYRNAIDRYYEGDFHIPEEEADAVERIFNREFNNSWLNGKEKWAFTNWETAGNQGVPLGHVIASGKGWVKLRLQDTLRVKDGIEIEHQPENWDKARQERPQGAPGAPEEYGFTVTQMFQDGHYIKEAGPGEIVEVRGRQWSAPGDPVYKTADIEVLERARATYEHGPHRTVPLTLDVRIRVDEPIQITARETSRGFEAQVRSDFVVQAARNAPLSETNVREQFDRLGDTPFHLEALTIDLQGGAFVPLSELNEARRKALDALTRTITTAYHRPKTSGHYHRRNELLSHTRQERDPARKMDLAVNCWGLPNLKAALAGGAKTVYFSGLRVGGLQGRWDMDALARAVQLAQEHGAELYIASGMVQKDAEVDMLQQALQAHGEEISGVLAGHHGALRVAQRMSQPVITDWPLNIYNSLTVDHLVQRLGETDTPVPRVTVSPELTLQDIEPLAGHTRASVEVLAHGRLQLMTSEYCSIGHATDCQLPGGSWAPCHDRKYQLRDR
ncbi:MAG: DUF3656 domain-containing protein, partial [Candidatus Thermoplasmatota archaeon]|nr:DUF3656 domain-containing protein [Candidatus Thermoplasmatota archaeon]